MKLIWILLSSRIEIRQKTGNSRVGQVTLGGSVKRSRSPRRRATPPPPPPPPPPGYSKKIGRSIWTMEREKRLIPFFFPSHRPAACFLIWWCLTPVSPWLGAPKQKSGLCSEVAVGRYSTLWAVFVLFFCFFHNIPLFSFSPVDFRWFGHRLFPVLLPQGQMLLLNVYARNFP